LAGPLHGGRIDKLSLAPESFSQTRVDPAAFQGLQDAALVLGGNQQPGRVTPDINGCDVFDDLALPRFIKKFSKMDDLLQRLKNCGQDYHKGLIEIKL
jgi:hypothetical protein